MILFWLCALAVLSLLAIPRFFNRHEVTLKHAVELLAKDLHSTQNRAAYRRTPATFHFRATGWEALDAEGRPLGANGPSHPIERSFAGIFEGVEIIRIDFGDDDAVHFDSAGDALEGGEVEIAFRDETRILRLDEITGLTTILGSEGVLLRDTRRGIDVGAQADVGAEAGDGH